MSETKQRTTLFEGQHLSLVQRDHWEYVQRHTGKPAVGVVALTDQDQIILVEQFRPPIDRRIVELASPGDLVITADIPLAAAVVDQGANALNPRGELYTEENIGARLAERNLVDTLRGGDLVTGGPAGYGPKEKQHFANQLDRWLTMASRRAASQRGDTEKNRP